MIFFQSIATTYLALVVSVIAAPAAHADERSSLAVKTKRADDKVEIQSAGDKAVVLIRSPFGISRAVIERSGNQWPTCLVLKLQLKGLEHLRLTNGKTTLEASMSAQGEKPSARQWKDHAEDAPLDPASPYWIKVRVLDRDGKPSKAIPLKDHVFELTLPNRFLEENPRSITVDWIDFYRG